MSELRTQLAAALVVLTGSACLPDAPSPIERPGFGLVGCLIEPSTPGPSFRMTIDDRADDMLVRTSLSVMTLPRDRELSDDFTHIAALTDGQRTIAVTLDQELSASVLLFGDPDIGPSAGSGKCERL